MTFASGNISGRLARPVVLESDTVFTGRPPQPASWLPARPYVASRKVVALMFQFTVTASVPFSGIGVIESFQPGSDPSDTRFALLLPWYLKLTRIPCVAW